LQSLNFNMMEAIAYIHEQLTGNKEFPKFKAGDNITVNYKIIEGAKERIQSFKGDVLKRQGSGATQTFTSVFTKHRFYYPQQNRSRSSCQTVLLT
jgi:ribosomal protein L19